MFRKWSILATLLLLFVAARPQNNQADTSIINTTDNITDTMIIDYDELFSDFDAFMDSILSPHNYFLASIGIGKGYYNFEAKNNTAIIEATKRLMYSPMIGYYHKGGLGITALGYIVNDNENMNIYQVALSPSYDYLKNRDLATGFSYTRFFTKKSLPFYTTPIQNELFGYFIYRKWWFKPSVSLSYGWGSRTDYMERESLIQDLRLRRNGFTYINTKESISDFSVVTSVRHDFYWLDIFTYKDHIRFTPQLSFTSGTQKFGFNQSSTTYGTLRTASNLSASGSSVLYSTENVFLDDELKFQPISLTCYLRGEYSIGKFFIQPQFLVDYYFPATEGNLTALFSLNLGFIF